MTASELAEHPGRVDAGSKPGTTSMKPIFQPDEVKLMRCVLDEAVILLPKAERTPTMKLRLATRILAAAGMGERDPNKLRIAALLGDDIVRGS